MTDPRLLSTPRVENFTIDVLDRQENLIGTLDNVTGGTITASVDARIKTAGKLTVIAEKPISWWADKRLQVNAHVNGVTWSLGVFIPSSPRMSHTQAGIEFQVELLDKLTILDKDCIGDALSIPPGTTLTTWATNYIAATGEKNITIEPSTRKNKRALTWEAGTPKLTVINDILDYIGYFSLLADQNGQYAATPYVIPRQRPISWTFGQSQHSLTATDYAYEQDLDSVPNKIIYIVQSASTVVKGVTVEGTVAQNPLRAVATDTSPDSPFSYQKRGRWITRVKTDAEAETTQELQEKAQRALENAQDPMTKIELQTALLPVRLNELARFTTNDYDLVGAIRMIEITLTPTALMKITIRKSKYELV